MMKEGNGPTKQLHYLMCMDHHPKLDPAATITGHTNGYNWGTGVHVPGTTVTTQAE